MEGYRDVLKVFLWPNCAKQLDLVRVSSIKSFLEHKSMLLIWKLVIRLFISGLAETES